MIIIGSELSEISRRWEQKHGIPASNMLNFCCNSFSHSYKKVHGYKSDNVRVIYDEELGELGIFAQKMVVTQVKDPQLEVSYADAKSMIDDVQLNEVLEIEITPESIADIVRDSQAFQELIYAQPPRVVVDERHYFGKDDDRDFYTIPPTPAITLDLHDYRFTVPEEWGWKRPDTISLYSSEHGRVVIPFVESKQTYLIVSALALQAGSPFTISIGREVEDTFQACWMTLVVPQWNGN